jgi:REP element-mobilizing transposase RayT
MQPSYLITFVCYGAWLHGREGAIDDDHSAVGSPSLEADAIRLAKVERLMKQESYCLDGVRRGAVLEGLKELCLRRGWILLAAHVRTNHVHAVLEADRPPEQVMGALKAYASRALNRLHLEGKDRRRWAHHGSTRYLWTKEETAAAIRYVVEGQGTPMAVFIHDS